MVPLIDNIDIIVDSCSLIVALLIVNWSFKAFRLTNERRHLYFSFAFLSIAAGMAFSILFNTLVDFEGLNVPLRGFIQLPLGFALILTFSMFAVILGYLAIIFVNEDIKSVKIAFLLALFALSVSWAAHDFYFIFHAAAAIMLLFISAHSMANHSRSRTRGSFLVAAGFSSLLLSHIAHSFTPYSVGFYVAGDTIRLIGFCLLFLALLQKPGKHKK